MNLQIYAPNVHLFAYHLRKASGQHNSELLWEKCNQILPKLRINNQLQVRQVSEGVRVDMLEGGATPEISVLFQGEIFPNGNANPPLNVECLITPLQIYDTYTLGLNIRRPEEENGQKTDYVDVSLLKHFNPDKCLMPEAINSYLGQTLLITAWMTHVPPPPKPETWQWVADWCLQEFMQETDISKLPPLNQVGNLFGSPIFEYGIPNQLDTYRHILVWLFTTPETDKKFGECYQDFIDLFCYRNKIVRAYKDTRKLDVTLKEKYDKIEQPVNECFPQQSEFKRLSKQELAAFKELLATMPKQSVEYDRLLRKLQDYHHTIGINVKNYDKKLEIISKVIKSGWGGVLDEKVEVLKSFREEDCPALLAQIKADLGYLQNGAGLVEQAIASIRGIVEIEQTERDRDLSIVIQVLGTGIGAAGIFAANYALVTSENPVYWPNASKIQWTFSELAPHPFVFSLVFSILFGALFALLAFLQAKWKS